MRERELVTKQGEGSLFDARGPAGRSGLAVVTTWRVLLAAALVGSLALGARSTS